MKNQVVNLGGINMKITATGADEALDKVNQLVDKLKEARTLVNELASMNVNINFGNDGEKLLND